MFHYVLAGLGLKLHMDMIKKSYISVSF